MGICGDAQFGGCMRKSGKIYYCVSLSPKEKISQNRALKWITFSEPLPLYIVVLSLLGIGLSTYLFDKFF